MSKKAFLKKYNQIVAGVDHKQNKDIKYLKKKVKELTDPIELKWCDNLSAGGSISSSGTVTSLTNLTVWAGSNLTRHLAREGTTVVLTSYRFKGLVQIPMTGVSLDSNNRVRIIIVRIIDNANSPAITDILQTNDIDSFYKIGGQVKYAKMFDKTYNMTGFTQTVTTGQSALGQCKESWRHPFNVDLKKSIGKTGLKLTYNATSGSGDDPNNNGMYMLLISDSSVPTHPTIKYKSRMRFRDN